MLRLLFPALLAAPLLLLTTATAHATFPVGPLSDDLFDPDSPNFAGFNFAFGTELFYTDFDAGGTPISTGLKGFVATPEQVGAIPNFASGVVEQLGGHDLDDLFPGGVGQPDSVNTGQVSQNIFGTGDFTTGFTSVQLDQRARLETSTDSPTSSQLQSEATGFVPFQVNIPSDEELLVRVLIELFASVNFEQDGLTSGSIVGTLLDITDPNGAAPKNGVNGGFIADGFGVSPFFTGGPDGMMDLNDSFGFVPGVPGESTDSVSFAYEFEESLQGGKTYALGLFSDGAAGIFGDGGTAKFDSSNTVSISIEVLTPGGALVLPGSAVIPEPSTGLLLVTASLAALARRRRAG